MPLPIRTLLSTMSLVTVRSAGVAARTLSLLTLAAGLPAERFATYALAFVLSELARCAIDFGLDPVLLRRAEGLAPAQQRAMIRAALAVRLAHGGAAALAVLLVLGILFPLDLLLAAAGLQFLAQGLLQLGLNWRQANDAAHRVAPLLLGFYGAIAALAVAAYFRPALGGMALPTLLAGELAMAAYLLAPLARPRLADLAAGYRTLIPQALPMAGIAFFAFVNTRTDALLVSRLVTAEEAGRYLYLGRWVDLAPMLATGFALPLVGKLHRLDYRRFAPLLVGMGIALAIMPFALVEAAALLNPDYASDAALRLTLAAIGACRIGLGFATVALLARWQDGVLVRIAPVVSIALPIATWLLGARFGLHGLAAGVLLVEGGNLAIQAALLLRGSRRAADPRSGDRDGGDPAGA